MSKFHQRFKTTEERFWEKVIMGGVDDCWEWRAGLGVMGYGQFSVSIGNSRSKNKMAHRMSWELEYGEVPESLQVLHKCDNRKCVNPNHLFLGTQQDNMDDMIQKNRCVRKMGESNHRSKLKEGDVREIRRLCSWGVPQRFIMKKFGISSGTVSRISTRHLWSHID